MSFIGLSPDWRRAALSGLSMPSCVHRPAAPRGACDARARGTRGSLRRTLRGANGASGSHSPLLRFSRAGSAATARTRNWAHVEGLEARRPHGPAALTLVGARAETFAARPRMRPGENNFPGVARPGFRGRRKAASRRTCLIWPYRRGARDPELHDLPRDVQSARQSYGHGRRRTVRRG